MSYSVARDLSHLGISVAFMTLAGLGMHAVHPEDPENPHGNRRERIEEIRLALSEASQNQRGSRTIESRGGQPNPPPQPSPTHQQVEDRVRRRDEMTHRTVYFPRFAA